MNRITARAAKVGFPDDLVERIKSAKPVGKPMTAEQFVEWLKQPLDDLIFAWTV